MSMKTPIIFASRRLVPLMTLAIALAIPAHAQSPSTPLLIWNRSLKGTEEQFVRWPVAVATSATGDIVVADGHESRLFVFRKRGLSWELDQVRELPGPPIDLVFDGNRFIASLRQRSDLVGFEGPELKQRRISLPKGVVPGPLAVLPSGGLAVYDFNGRRVLKLDASGSVSGQFSLVGFVTALSATSGGRLMATLVDPGVVLLLSPDGETEDTWRLPGEGPVPPWPVALAVDSTGDVYVVDRHASRILVLGGTGALEGTGSRRGWEPGLLLYPSDVDLLPDGGVVVADGGNGRVQVFERARPK